MGAWGWGGLRGAGVPECEHRLSWAEGIKRLETPAAATTTASGEAQTQQVVVVDVEHHQDVGGTHTSRQIFIKQVSDKKTPD